MNLLHVFPMPGLVKVRTKAKALSVFDEPAIGGSVDLDRAVRIFGIDRTAADVEIQSAASEVRAVINCKTRATCIG